MGKEIAWLWQYCGVTKAIFFSIRLYIVLQKVEKQHSLICDQIHINVIHHSSCVMSILHFIDFSFYCLLADNYDQL